MCSLIREDVSRSLAVFLFWAKIRRPAPPLPPETRLKNSPCCQSGVEAGWSHPEMQEPIQHPMAARHGNCRPTWQFSCLGFFSSRELGKHLHWRGRSADEEDRERSGLVRQGKYCRNYVRAFFFLLKHIVPNVINRGLAPTTILPSDYRRVSLDSDQFNWNQSTAEGVWKLLSIFNTPETWLGM